MISNFKLRRLAGCLPIRRFGLLNESTQEQLDLVQKTYRDLVELAHVQYP